MFVNEFKSKKVRAIDRYGVKRYNFFELKKEKSFPPGRKAFPPVRVARKYRDKKLSLRGEWRASAGIKSFPLRGEWRVSAERGLRLEKLLMKAFPLDGLYCSIRLEVFPLDGVMQNRDDIYRPCFAGISNRLNWGKCRSCDLLLF